MTAREQTKQVPVGNVSLGGGSPVLVQSMLNVPAGDVAGNVAQAVRLEKAGCESCGWRCPPWKTPGW